MNRVKPGTYKRLSKTTSTRWCGAKLPLVHIRAKRSTHILLHDMSFIVKSNFSFFASYAQHCMPKVRYSPISSAYKLCSTETQRCGIRVHLSFQPFPTKSKLARYRSGYAKRKKYVAALFLLMCLPVRPKKFFQIFSMHRHSLPLLKRNCMRNECEKKRCALPFMKNRYN